MRRLDTRDRPQKDAIGGLANTWITLRTGDEGVVMTDRIEGRRRDANIALLIDADNASADRLEEVLAVLAELGLVSVRRAYGNWTKPGLKAWAALLHRFAIEPQHQIDLTKGKNATDMKMTIDAMDLLFGGRVDGFGIMSSDSDFMPLAMRLRQDGLPVYGFGRSTTPEGFRQACDRFIDVDALAVTAAAPIEVVGERTIADALPPSIPRPPIDETVVNLLGKAWKSAKRDERGFAKLAEVGTLANNQSSFDARSYGYPRLSGLVAALPAFTVEKRDDGLWVKRTR